MQSAGEVQKAPWETMESQISKEGLSASGFD